MRPQRRPTPTSSHDLADLHSAGKLDDAEYAAAKAKVLG